MQHKVHAPACKYYNSHKHSYLVEHYISLRLTYHHLKIVVHVAVIDLNIILNALSSFRLLQAK